jgi:hypothetical protein
LHENGDFDVVIAGRWGLRRDLTVPSQYNPPPPPKGQCVHYTSLLSTTFLLLRKMLYFRKVPVGILSRNPIMTLRQ